MDKGFVSNQEGMILKGVEILCRMVLGMEDDALDRLQDVIQLVKAGLNVFRGEMIGTRDCQH